MSEQRRSRAVSAARVLLLVLAGVTGWGAVAAAGGTGDALHVTLAGPPAPTASPAPAALLAPTVVEPRAEAARTARREAASRSKTRLDPRFRTCSQALAAGFGPYRRGLDPEYAWYPDADSDGVTCDGPDQPVDAGL